MEQEKNGVVAASNGSEVIKPVRHFEWPIITDEVREVVVKQLDDSISVYNRSGIVEEFEENFRKYHARKHGLLCNSGTSAILAMFVGIGIKAGDEVIAPTYTFFATASPLMILGATAVFADCLPDGNMDPEDLKKKITTRTKAVIITHMWGVPCDMDEIVRICRESSIKLLEDCSHAHGAKYKGKHVGTFGVAAAWSLQAQKIVTGGQGGILLMDDETVYARAQLLGSFNKRCLEEISKEHPLYMYALTGFGLNHRIHPVSAAMANQQFKYLDTWLAQKRKFVAQFLEVLKEIPFLDPPKFEDKEPAWYAFVMQFKPEACKVSIDDFIGLMHKLGLIEIERPRSTGPIHSFPLFTKQHEVFPLEFPAMKSDEDKQQEAFPVAEKFYENAVKLPVWVRPEDSEFVEMYINGLKKVAKEIAIK